VKSATVYVAVDGIVRIDPLAVTTSGVAISRGERVARLGQPSDEALGEAVVQALSVAGNVVPHPKQDEWPREMGTWLKAMGYPSYQRFMRDNVALSVTVDADRLRLLPMQRSGGRGGYEHRPDLSTSLAVSASSSELGAAIRSAMPSEPSAKSP
jgi:hypothetical protein